MSDETLRLLKAHCRVDHDDDDGLLQELYDAAVDYLDGAGISISDSAKYRLTAFSLVLEWYDGAPIGNVTVGTQRLINQLKLNAIAQSEDPAF